MPSAPENVIPRSGIQIERYNTPVAATAGRGKLRYNLVYPPSFWQARRKKAASTTEVHCGNLI